MIKAATRSLTVGKRSRSNAGALVRLESLLLRRKFPTPPSSSNGAQHRFVGALSTITSGSTGARFEASNHRPCPSFQQTYLADQRQRRSHFASNDRTTTAATTTTAAAADTAFPANFNLDWTRNELGSPASQLRRHVNATLLSYQQYQSFNSRRYMATTTAASGTGERRDKEEDKSAESPTTCAQRETASAKEKDEALTLREQYRQEGLGKTIRHRAAEIQSSARVRAETMQASAREEYAEFRQEQASVKSGAKSFSSMMQEYGPVFLGTYLGIYVTTLASLFGGIQSGLLDPVSLFSYISSSSSSDLTDATTVQLVVDWMKSHSIPYADTVENYPQLANLAVAWIAVKFTEPVRLPTAMWLTPKVARYFNFVQTPTTTTSNPSSTEEKETNEGGDSSEGLAQQEDKKKA